MAHPFSGPPHAKVPNPSLISRPIMSPTCHVPFPPGRASEYFFALLFPSIALANLIENAELHIRTTLNPTFEFFEVLF